MAETTTKDIYQVTWLIRRAFRLMGTRVDQYLNDLDISACDRSVMDYLYLEKKLSVPQIAERYDVSRQHIQSIVNSLLEHDLVELHDNPKHKRSPLISLSATGATLYKEIKKRDLVVFNSLFTGINQSDSKTTLKTLETLVENLTEAIEQNRPKGP